MAESRAEVVVDRLWNLYRESYSPFPSENIGVEEGEDTSITDSESQIDYWQETYGGRDAFECLVRTVLSQNTSDVASQPAHDALMEKYGPSDGEDDPDADLAAALAAADHDELADTIRPAGLYNRKADVLIAVGERVLAEYGSATDFDAFVREGEESEVRAALLDMGGVGPKTADCVLLFAGGQAGVFPVDTHVHRIYRRLGIAPPDADHEAVRAVLEREVPAEKCGFGPQTIAKRYKKDGQSEEREFHNGGTYEVDGEEITFAHGGVPPEKCGFGHTATIQFGREYCTARKPACLEGPEACPLYDLCDRVGVDPEFGEVVDPAETV